MIDPQLWLPHADNLVGVVDLKSGLAVHGIAGKRTGYQPVTALLRDGKPADGDPLALVRWYRRFQIRNFYLADLDGLMHGKVQRQAIESLLEQTRDDEGWMIDAGVSRLALVQHADWMRGLAETTRRVDWILASESADHPSVIERASEHIGPNALILGVDFRSGRFIGPNSDSDSDLDSWLTTADQRSLRRSLVLDVAAVGLSGGPQSLPLCRTLAKRFPHWRLISGGGCRHQQDVVSVVDAGCEQCLIASALLPAAT